MCEHKVDRIVGTSLVQHLIEPAELLVDPVALVGVDADDPHIAVVFEPPMLVIFGAAVGRKAEVFEIIGRIAFVVAGNGIHRHLGEQLAGRVEKVSFPLDVVGAVSYQVTRNHHQGEIVGYRSSVGFLQVAQQAVVDQFGKLVGVGIVLLHVAHCHHPEGFVVGGEGGCFELVGIRKRLAGFYLVVVCRKSVKACQLHLVNPRCLIRYGIGYAGCLFAKLGAGAIFHGAFFSERGFPFDFDGGRRSVLQVGFDE